MVKPLRVAKKATEFKLDLGCGKNCREGFEGVDVRDFGQKWKVDLALVAPKVPGKLIDPRTNKEAIILPSGFLKWPWKDSSVDEARASHFVEHFTAPQRIHFVNELWRVLKPDAKCEVTTPHWCSIRAYGDLTHQWPPVSEMWFYYLSKNWRATNAPHNDGYVCDFAVTWGYNLRNDLMSRNQEFQTYAMQNFKEAAQDIIATFQARK